MLRALISAAFVSPLLTLLLVTGCSDSPAPEQQSSKTETKIENETLSSSDSTAIEEDSHHTDAFIFVGRYRCEEGNEFLLNVSDHSASLEMEGVIYELRQQPAASGAFYAGELWQVHSKDNHALLIGQDSTRDCQLLFGAESDHSIPLESATGKN